MVWGWKNDLQYIGDQKGHGLKNLLKNYFTHFHIKSPVAWKFHESPKGVLEVNFWVGEKSPAMFVDPFDSRKVEVKLEDL